VQRFRVWAKAHLDASHSPTTWQVRWPHFKSQFPHLRSWRQKQTWWYTPVGYSGGRDRRILIQDDPRQVSMRPYL
jgi:hypothetical protein